MNNHEKFSDLDADDFARRLNRQCRSQNLRRHRRIKTLYEVVQLPDAEGFLICATMRTEIDTSDLEKFLQKDAEEISQIVAAEKILRMQEEQQDKKSARRNLSINGQWG